MFIHMKTNPVFFNDAVAIQQDDHLAPSLAKALVACCGSAFIVLTNEPNRKGFNETVSAIGRTIVHHYHFITVSRIVLNTDVMQDVGNGPTCVVYRNDYADKGFMCQLYPSDLPGSWEAIIFLLVYGSKNRSD